MATLTNSDIAKAIYLASKDGGDVVAQAMQFIVHRRLMSRTPGILSHLEKIINKAENKIVAKITTAEKLTHEHKTDLEQFLKKRYEVKEVLFHEIIDTGVVGGIKVEIEDEVIDLTVKNRIRKLQEHLIS